MPIDIGILSGHVDVPTQLDAIKKKSIAYFDEKVTVLIFSTETTLEKGQMELELIYDNRGRVPCDLELIKGDNSKEIWVWRGYIKPKRACHKLTFKACYKPVLVINDDVKLDKYQQIDLIDLNGILLCENLALEDQKPSIVSNPKFQCEYTLNVSSLFRMSIRSFSIKSGLWVACLEVSNSNTINPSEIGLTIQKIDIKSDNWYFKPIANIDFPLVLKPNIKLALAYQITNTDTNTLKPISCIITSTIHENTEIKTNWVTNIDLNNNNPKHSLNPASASVLPLPNGIKSNRDIDLPDFKQSKSVPLLKSAKQRTTSHIISSNTNFEKLPPQQRHSSYKRKSSSATSLNAAALSNSLNSKRGLKIKVSGPTNVQLGKRFRWNLKLSNQSTEKMELIIYVQSSINKDYEKSFPPIPIQSGPSYDPVPLYNNQQLVRNFYQKFNKSGIISLSNHLRVPLDSGSLFETELVLIGFERGLFNLYDLRIVDVVSGTIFECGKLLDVLVV